MTFIKKLKMVLDHYHIPYEENVIPFNFKLKGHYWYVYHETGGYRVVRETPNCIYCEEWFFNPKQFNDLADIVLEDIGE